MNKVKPAPKLLDAKEIKKCTLPKAEKIKELTEAIKKFNKTEHIQLAKVIKDQIKPREAPSANLLTTVLELKMSTMDEDTRTWLFHETVPREYYGTDKFKAYQEAFQINGAYIPRLNHINVPFEITHYKGKAKEQALLDTGATENFIDKETVQ